MSDALSALISGGLDFGANLISSSRAYNAQMKTNEMNYQIMKEQMKFSRENAKNAHQWEVSDLRKAGLNPILSSKYGGAQVSSVPSPNMVSPGSGFPDSIGGLATARLISDLKSQNVQRKLTKATIQKAQAEQKAASALAFKLGQEGRVSQMEANWHTSKAGQAVYKTRDVVGSVSPVLSGVAGGVVGGMIKGGITKNVVSGKWRNP